MCTVGEEGGMFSRAGLQIWQAVIGNPLRCNILLTDGSPGRFCRGDISHTLTLSQTSSEQREIERERAERVLHTKPVPVLNQQKIHFLLKKKKVLWFWTAPKHRVGAY